MPIEWRKPGRMKLKPLLNSSSQLNWKNRHLLAALQDSSWMVQSKIHLSTAAVAAAAADDDDDDVVVPTA